MRVMKFICALTATLFISSESTYAESENCAHALIQDVGELDLREFQSLARAEMFRRELESNKDWAASITVPIKGLPVGGSAESAESMRESYFSASKLNWDSKRIVSASTQTLSEKSVEAYRNCIDGQHESGPRIWVHDATRTKATVTIKWISPTNAPTETNKVDIKISGGKFDTKFPKEWKDKHELKVFVTRKSDEDLRVIANIGGGSDDVFISRFPSEVVKSNVQEIAYCVGKGGQLGVHLWGPRNLTCNGVMDFGLYNADPQKVIRVGSCIGRGGFEGVHLWGPVGKYCGGQESWGQYGDIVSMGIANDGLGSCVAKGNVLGGHLLYGPKGQPCGGIWPNAYE